jgi:hypothetical protein
MDNIRITLQFNGKIHWDHSLRDGPTEKIISKKHAVY